MTTAERELTEQECDAIADKCPVTPGGYRQYDRALIRAGWQARAGAIAPPPDLMALLRALYNGPQEGNADYEGAKLDAGRLLRAADAAPIAPPREPTEIATCLGCEGAYTVATGHQCAWTTILPIAAQPAEPDEVAAYRELMAFELERNIGAQPAESAWCDRLEHGAECPDGCPGKPSAQPAESARREFYARSDGAITGHDGHEAEQVAQPASPLPPGFKTLAEYIATLPQEDRDLIEKLRPLVRAALYAPDAAPIAQPAAPARSCSCGSPNGTLHDVACNVNEPDCDCELSSTRFIGGHEHAPDCAITKWQLGPTEPVAQPVAHLRPALRGVLTWETCLSSATGAFPVYAAPVDRHRPQERVHEVAQASMEAIRGAEQVAQPVAWRAQHALHGTKYTHDPKLRDEYLRDPSWLVTPLLAASVTALPKATALPPWQERVLLDGKWYIADDRDGTLHPDR